MQHIQGLENFIVETPIINIPDIKIGESGKATVLITKLETKQDKNGNDYCNIDIADGVNEYNAKMWKKSANECDFTEGDVVDAIIIANPYNNGISYAIESAIVNKDEKPENFAIGAPIPIEDMYSWIESAVSQMHEPICSIIQKLLFDNKEIYCFSAAARGNHHAYIGGLLYHSYRMAKSAELLCSVYKADKDLTIAGCLIHDIGKIQELSTNSLGQTEYTIDGQLEGHIQIGIRMLDDAARKLDIPLDNEDVKMLRHIISSHHGRIEFGSATVPATAEAILVSNLDNLDMRESVWELETKLLTPGTSTIKVNPILETKPYLKKQI